MTAHELTPAPSSRSAHTPLHPPRRAPHGASPAGCCCMRTMLRGKIHRATVTQADLDYVGSISIDETLMEAAGIVEWEQVHVLDITNGARLTTYAITAPAGSGVICINGAAAHLVHPGDLVDHPELRGRPEERLGDAPPAARARRFAQPHRGADRPQSSTAREYVAVSEGAYDEPLCTPSSRSPTSRPCASVARRSRCSPRTTTPPPASRTRRRFRSCSSATRSAWSSSGTSPRCR